LLVIPAIDLKNGRCVRLRQGRMSDETVYSEAPEEVALKWLEKGAERLHVVDLDGAIQRRPVHRDTLQKIVDSVPIPVQVGGGIRSLETIRDYLDSGVYAVILGTVAFKDPELLSRACREYPGRILLGLDARRGKIALEGWTQEVELSAIEAARRFEGGELGAIIYTDIQKDGMGTGPSIESTKLLAESVNVSVIASGGISDIEDVKKVLHLSGSGVIGMITGRALYEGTLDLEAAIQLSREGSRQK
jgi:phosphoribosylformimino-5-aminoimidazole carboxamide ribotide isomerase